MPPPKPLIFVSHIHEESALAVALEKELSRMFLGGVDFFVSSDRESGHGGETWLVQVKDNLSRAAVVITLVSHKSVDRAWVNFEAGAGWLQKRVIPLCHSGMRPSQLPQPLQFLYSYNLHDHADLEALCKLVGKYAGLQLPVEDWRGLTERLSATADQVASSVMRPTGALACWVFPKNEDVATASSLAHSLEVCKEIKMCATGLNFLWNAGHLQLFEDRLSRGTLRARICMGNFRSKGVRQRIADEPDSPVGPKSSENLVRHLIRLEKTINDSSRFAIRCFNHYPTYGMLVFDDELYVYPYGFQALGNFSPTFFWKGRDPAFQFFERQFEDIWRTATAASEVYR